MLAFFAHEVFLRLGPAAIIAGKVIARWNHQSGAAIAFVGLILCTAYVLAPASCQKQSQSGW